MNTYRVLVHPEKSAAIVVKDGFCWPAFLIGPFWFLVNGMWLNFLIVALFTFGSNLFLASNHSGGILVSLLTAVDAVVWILIGALGNWLLYAELIGNGYVQRGTVQASGMWKASKLAQPVDNDEQALVDSEFHAQRDLSELGKSRSPQ